MGNKNVFLYQKVLYLLFILFFLQLTVSVFADDHHDLSIYDVLKEIRNEQGVEKNSQIDPEKVSDKLLEELGDAVMSVNHPNEKVHEWMDNMMGGEGSESLKARHIAMGYNYLTGITGRSYGRGYENMPMMGGGFMMGNGYNMMGQFGAYPWFGGIFMGLLFLALIGGVIFFAVYAVKKNNSGQNEELTALEILKRRYVSGEITKEEYEEKKRTIL